MKQSNSSQIYDYIILGAGISGIQSLQILSRKTKNILAIQSQNYQGGRVLSETITELPGAQRVNWIQDKYDQLKNVYIEKGATWIEQQHSYLLKICQNFGIKLRAQNTLGENIYLYKDNSMTPNELSKDKCFGPYLRQFVTKIDHLSKIYDRQVLTSSNKKSRASRILSQYDSKLVSEYLQENIPSKQARDLVQNFLQHTQCVSCQQNSMHEVLTKNARSNDVGILKQFLGEYGHEASYILDNGTSIIIEKFIQIIQKQMKKKRQNIIRYNQSVITIDNGRPDFCVITTVDNKNKTNIYKCRRVICTIPLAVSRSILFTNISKAKRFIFDNQLRTSCLKTFLITKKPFWRPRFSGDALFSAQHLINMCHDISPTDESCGILVFFHNGKKYKQWESRFKNSQSQYQAKKNYIVQLTCKLFKVDQKTKNQCLQDCLVYLSTFMDNPHIRSGFQSCTSPGTFSTLLKFGQDVQSFYRDQNNIYFIGSEYSQQFASYMEGAIRVARKKCFDLIGQSDDLFQEKDKKNGLRPKL